MTTFSTVSEEHVETIRKANDKSRSLDPIPTKILKQHLLTLLPVIRRMINASLNKAIIPSVFIQARLTPILKKPSLDKDSLWNYRHISNLAFISKMIGGLVDLQITAHVENKNLNEVMQAAYRQHHSTETAWVCLHNDILTAIDNMAVLLDYGVPKGSVLGPKFFALYMLDQHWLPIKKRIEYKILVLTFKCVHNLAPVYLTELLHNRTNKVTRADNKNLLVVPKIKKSPFEGAKFQLYSTFSLEPVAQPPQTCFKFRNV